MQTLALPFEIGAQYWMPHSGSRQVTVICPVCAGQLAVTLTLGSGEQVGVPCEACGLGYDGPQGTIREWVHDPGAEPFVIAEVVYMRTRGDVTEWRVRSTDRNECDFHELYPSEAEALAVSEQQCAEQHERNMQSRQHKRKGAARASWSIQYHREQIKTLEQQLAWHRARIEAVPKKLAG